MSDRADETARAVVAWLRSLGHEPTGELADTPERVASLWRETLLGGEGADLAALLSGGSPVRSSDPVGVVDIGIHLVCPHHLTVALGAAHIAYIPGERVAGFGSLASLAEACTARLILQEDATRDIAEALVTHLGARSAVASLRAVHPCHNVLHPRSQSAEAFTWAQAGDAAFTGDLREWLRGAIDDHRRGDPTP